jgi:DNA-binding CsgD family transcriptional regulator
VLIEQIDGAFAAALARHARATRGDELDQASLCFESLGALLLAAETAAAAVPVYRADGLARAATAAARRSERLLAECGDVQPPGLHRASTSVTLTAREAEIAGLAARGATSRQIADRLVVSVRTVDNHLQSSYTKLGVTNRDELAKALHLT